MPNKPLKTVEDLIRFLKTKNPNQTVWIDTNHLNGGSFEYLVEDSVTESQDVILRTTKGY